MKLFHHKNNHLLYTLDDKYAMFIELNGTLYDTLYVYRYNGYKL